MTRKYRSPRLLNGLKKSTFIFASVIFLMLRYLWISYCFKVLVSVLVCFLICRQYPSNHHVGMSTQLYGSLLNDCTFLVIHKVKYCMVLSDFVWVHHLAILRYTWQKRKQLSFSFLHYTDSCRPTCIWRNQRLGLSSKASVRPYLSFIFIRTKSDKFLTKQAHFHFIFLEHLKKKKKKISP